MSTELVTVVVGGQYFRSWEMVKIRAAVKEAARSFELKVAVELGATATASAFQAFTPLQIYSIMVGPSGPNNAGLGDLLFTGFVDRYRPHLSKDSAHIEISGRAKGQDAIDSSVEHRKSDYVNKSVLDIAKDQDQFGIGFAVDPSVQLTQIDRYRPNPGETLFQALDPLCHDDECTMAGQPDGSILLTKAGANPPRQGAIIEGVNLLIGEADLNVSGRHSKVNAHGQAAYGNGAQNTQISVLANDSTVPRNRPLHLHHHRHTNRSRLANKATHHRNHEAGNAIRATPTMQGWRDDSGLLWTPGYKTFVQSPFLAIIQDMLIEGVTYEQDVKEGTLTKLDLVDPRAHGGQGGGVDKSGSSWNMDSSSAS